MSTEEAKPVVETPTIPAAEPAPATTETAAVSEPVVAEKPAEAAATPAVADEPEASTTATAAAPVEAKTEEKLPAEPKYEGNLAYKPGNFLK
jgi:hypothetical protein